MPTQAGPTDRKRIRAAFDASLRTAEGLTLNAIAVRLHTACKRAFSTRVRALQLMQSRIEGDSFHFGWEMRTKTDWFEVLVRPGVIEVYGMPLACKSSPNFTPQVWHAMAGYEPLRFEWADPQYHAKLADKLTLLMGKAIWPEWLGD